MNLQIIIDLVVRRIVLIIRLELVLCSVSEGGLARRHTRRRPAESRQLLVEFVHDAQDILALQLGPPKIPYHP